jgi:hypothetical protein
MGSKFDFTLSFGSDGVDKLVNSAMGKFDRLGAAVKNRVFNFLGPEAWIARGKALIDYADRIYDVNVQTGLGTEKLQAWDYAAESAGGHLEDLTQAYKFFQRAQNAALTDPKMAQAMARLGISRENLKGDATKNFETAAESIGKSQQSAQKMADVMVVMGRGTNVTMGIFRQGFQNATSEAEKLGLVLNDKVIRSLHQASEEWKIINKQMTFATAGPLRFLSGAFLGLEAFSIKTKSVFQEAIRQSHGVGAELKAKGLLLTPDQYGEMMAQKFADRVLGAGNEPGGEAGGPGGLPQSARGKPQVQVDTLARMGLYRGGVDAQTNIAKQQLSKQNAMLNELRGLNRNIKA